jgi:2,3-bisphosphoglycerate-dependent phosphoglycerate mutase
MDRVIRVWLIRHGQSESNAGLPSGEPGTSALTALGHWQAEQVALGFAQPPALIVTSSYLRARQTAEPTARRFPAVAREEWPVQEFTYLGDLRKRPMTSTEREPYVRAYWERCDPQEASGGAESFADLVRRGRDFLDRLATQAAGPVAVFTHGLFMRCVAWSLLSGVTEPTAADMQAYRQFAAGYRTPNGGVVELRCWPGRPVPSLMGGATFHLPATGLPASRQPGPQLSAELDAG